MTQQAVVLTGVVCERCGFRFKAPKNCVWPCGCPKCTGDAAPSWWFRENNPDQKAKRGRAEIVKENGTLPPSGKNT